MDSDLTMVLLGNAGVGKSASGNTILGRQAFESKASFKPVTTRIREETGVVFGKQISVIDTPGILGSEELIRSCCQDVLRASRCCLFLLVLSVRRFTEEDEEAVKAAIRLLGDQSFRETCLLFTGGDNLNMFLEDFILQYVKDSLQNVFERFEGRHHLFNNQNGGQEQVQELLEKSGHHRQLSDSPAVGLLELVSQEERRIVLLGRPGGGKSSSGNTILGSSKFKSHSGFTLVSTECVSESGTVEGCKVTVVDTPGFTDDLLTPELLFEGIMKSLVTASPGPHAFVIVVRIGKIFSADEKLFEILPKLFGSDASKYGMVLFTGGDQLRGRSIDQLIQSNRCVSGLISRCGRRYCVFNNNQRGDRQQVRNLLNQINEMVAANGGEHYTSDMFRRPKLKKTFCERLSAFVARLNLAELVGLMLAGGLVVAGFYWVYQMIR